MRYFIKPDKHTSCEGRFPNELSLFLEQVSGYGEKSEAAQVADLLNVDLSEFTRQAQGTSMDEELSHWKDVDVFTELIRTFIAKLHAQPEYYKVIRYNANQNKQNEQLVNVGFKNTNAFLELLEEFQAQPNYGYPTDYGYLSTGRILQDLSDLYSLLHCYKRNGVTKIKLYYL